MGTGTIRIIDRREVLLHGIQEKGVDKLECCLASVSLDICKRTYHVQKNTVRLEALMSKGRMASSDNGFFIAGPERQLLFGKREEMSYLTGVFKL